MNKIFNSLERWKRQSIDGMYHVSWLAGFCASSWFSAMSAFVVELSPKRCVFFRMFGSCWNIFPFTRQPSTIAASKIHHERIDSMDPFGKRGLCACTHVRLRKDIHIYIYICVCVCDSKLSAWHLQPLCHLRFKYSGTCSWTFCVVFFRFLRGDLASLLDGEFFHGHLPRAPRFQFAAWSFSHDLLLGMYAVVRRAWVRWVSGPAKIFGRFSQQKAYQVI